MKKEDKDLEFIKGFSKISIKSICEKLKINRSNLLYGRSTLKNSARVKEEIENEIKEVYKRVYDR